VDGWTRTAETGSHGKDSEVNCTYFWLEQAHPALTAVAQSGTLPFWTEARADEIEGGDAAVAERAEEVLLDDLPEDIARPLHPKLVEDMQSIADLVAAGMNELEPVSVTEPGGELRSCGLCSRNLNGTRRDQRTHSHVRRERAGEPAEVPLGERRDQSRAEISG
jgi:hypothetical protein